MKAREISVNVVDFGGELYVMTTMKLKGVSLTREDNVVTEKSRRERAKAIKAALETVEFPFTVE
jgi:hypothetical protein